METYRYVRLGELYNTIPSSAILIYTPLELPEADFVFVNGVFGLIFPPPGGVIALPLSKAFHTYGSYLNGRFARLTQDEKDPSLF